MAVNSNGTFTGWATSTTQSSVCAGAQTQAQPPIPAGEIFNLLMQLARDEPTPVPIRACTQDGRIQALVTQKMNEGKLKTRPGAECYWPTLRHTLRHNIRERMGR